MNFAIRLGVNIDHVATLRQARGTLYPDPVHAAFIAVDAGADGITVHLREDRRHIQEHDVRVLHERLTVPLNLEMAATPAMVEFAMELKPEKCCLVPERREELTTEGGLDVLARQAELAAACQALGEQGIEVSLFIDPEIPQIEAAAAVGVPVVELHTGAYADGNDVIVQTREYERLKTAAGHAIRCNLQANAGHGLHYHNVAPVAALKELTELNIGHSIVARALFHGFDTAVRDMKSIMSQASR